MSWGEAIGVALDLGGTETAPTRIYRCGRDLNTNQIEAPELAATCTEKATIEVNGQLVLQI